MGRGRGGKEKGRGRRGENLQLAYLLPRPDLLICFLLLNEPQYFCGGMLSFCPMNVMMAGLLQPSHIVTDGFLVGSHGFANGEAKTCLIFNCTVSTIWMSLFFAS